MHFDLLYKAKNAQDKAQRFHGLSFDIIDPFFVFI